MKAIPIFPRNIYGETLLGFDQDYLNGIEATIELFRRGNITGRELSNQDFGYQSCVLPHDGVFQNLTDKIITVADEFLKSIEGFKYSQVKLEDMWANINYPNDINWPHFDGDELAGVYYINATKDSGNLFLQSYDYSEKQKIKRYLVYKDLKSIEPVNDKLVLFDATLHHCVKKNLSDELRISMSFNIILNGSRRGSHEIRTYLGKGKFKNT